MCHARLEAHGVAFCGTHCNQEFNAGPRIAGHCPAIKQNKRRCMVETEHASGRCAHHRERDRFAVRNVPPLLLVHPLNLPAPPVVVAAPLPTRLRLIAQDTQNVHTREVNKQMNDGLAKLTQLHIHPSQNTMPEITAAYMTKLRIMNYDLMLDLMRDMNKWYTTETCVNPRDKLYKRALDGLWSKIRPGGGSESMATELVCRLYQETWEARGLCCDGHLSRLCNVMVGFDDAFLPPVPVGEILQNKMSAISSKEIELAEKIKQANLVFEELAIPIVERSAWLEAF